MVIMLTACLSFFYFAVRAGMKARSRFEANLTFLLAAMCMAMNVISMCVSIGMLPTMVQVVHYQNMATKNDSLSSICIDGHLEKSERFFMI